MDNLYDQSDITSIINYAKKLKGKNLRDACGAIVERHGIKGKGNFGQILEKFYFGYALNSKSIPDFDKVGLELKSSPLKTLKNKSIKSKERLVLNIINYVEVHNEEFESSSFWKKNAHLLLVFYLYDKDIEVVDYVIKLVDEWNYSDNDLMIIKQDWELIREKIKKGKAHEISEGDTFYLGACTKGETAASSLREQPFNKVKAKQRAYSLKQGYVNHIIANIAEEEPAVYGKILKKPYVIDKSNSLENIVISKFKPFYGRTDEEIKILLSCTVNISAKNFHSMLTKAILGIDINKKIEEFDKSEIQIKTVRVEENNSIKQHMSFPAMRFTEIYNNKWIDSEMKDITEKKFFFVFFKKDKGAYKLNKVKFWNMPYSDRQEVRKVWLKTKCIIQGGSIFKEFKTDKFGKITYTKKGNKTKLNNLPKTTENKVCHVRPHGKDSSDTYPLPIQDKILKVNDYSKQCFWYSKNYIRDEILLRDD